MSNRVIRLILIGIALLTMPAFAQEAGGILPAIKMTTTPEGAQEYSVTLQILILMTLLTFLPAIVIMMTSFIRISVVFAILRQALGLQQTPSNQILVGLTLFLTFFIMAPVISQVYDEAVQPYMNEELTSTQALDIAKEPFRDFMLGQVRENDLMMFASIAEVAIEGQRYDQVPFTVLVPAFITSELKTAFQIGFLIFIPFLVIDLVIASILMAMGMMMLSPMIVSLPFKIMLFVLIDGWALVVGTLANSFG
ncbi:MAG: flagellar type III secretion system pore protein FliP [Gammaproteobacteria bacterium]|nr:flagellar type III secretion system pore protein FliP [Gammaproteobacteria bacterium]